MFPAGGVALAVGVGVAPGGGSGIPLRPQAASINPAAVSAASAKTTLKRLKAKRPVPQKLLQHSRSHRGGEILAITPCHRVYYSCRRNSAFTFKTLEPAPGLGAHAVRRGAAVDLPAFHRSLDRKDAENRFGDARLDRLHGRERQFIERDAGGGRLGDDPAGDMVSLAKRQLERRA